MGFCFYCPSDLSLTKFKLPKTYAAKDIHFFTRSINNGWTFNSGFALTSFWTTWPRLICQSTGYIHTYGFHVRFWNCLCFSGNRVNLKVTAVWLLTNQRSFLLKQGNHINMPPPLTQSDKRGKAKRSQRRKTRVICFMAASGLGFVKLT